MKIASSLSVVALAVCTLASGVFATTYQSANGYQITPPDGFVSRPASTSIQNENINIVRGEFDSLFVGQHKETVSVVIENAPQGATLPTLLRYVPAFMERALTSNNTQVSGTGFPTMRSKTRTRVLSKGYTTVGGLKAITFLSRTESGNPSVSSLARQVLVMRKGWLMTFSCTAPSKTFWKMAPAFNRTLSTVRWTR